MKKVLLELSNEQCASIDRIAKMLKRSRSSIIRSLCEMTIGLSDEINITMSDKKNIKTMRNFKKPQDCIVDNIGILYVEHHFNEKIGVKYTAEGVQKVNFGGDNNVEKN